jgi:predicted dehydrogenase
VHDEVFSEAGSTKPASFRLPADNTTRVRVALVGCVNAPLLYVPALAAHPLVDLAALVDRDRSAARAWSRPFGARIPIFETVGELLAEAPAVQGAVVASPLTERAAEAADLLSAGVNVLSEPPFAATLFEAEALLSAAEAGGAILMPAFARRFEPGIAELERRIAEGAMGALRQVRCFWRFPCLGTPLEMAADAYVLGWSALWPALACQSADLARWWLGEALGVSADIEESEGDPRARRTEAFANLIVRHERGHAIHQIARIRSTLSEESYSVTGAEGEIEIGLSGPGISGDEPVWPLLRPYGRPTELLAPLEIPEVDPNPTRGAAAVARYRRLLGHFADCVAGRAEPQLKPEDLRAAIEIACAAVLSSADEAKVPIPLRGQADAGATILKSPPAS